MTSNHCFGVRYSSRTILNNAYPSNTPASIRMTQTSVSSMNVNGNDFTKMMMMNQQDNSNWTCPNDRELMLRAKLETGWSCKTGQFQQLNGGGNKSEKITEPEKRMIIEVLSRAQKSEEIEKKRISKMIERLRNMKRNAIGDGYYTCILCNESFGFFSLNAHQCQGCCKLVCNKCSIDTINDKKETVWLCKICSETREILKKSGSWFNEVKNQLDLT